MRPNSVCTQGFTGGTSTVVDIQKITIVEYRDKVTRVSGVPNEDIYLYMILYRLGQYTNQPRMFPVLYDGYKWAAIWPIFETPDEYSPEFNVIARSAGWNLDIPHSRIVRPTIRLTREDSEIIEMALQDTFNHKERADGTEDNYS